MVLSFILLQVLLSILVKEIDSKVLFPVHTEYPTEYARVTNKINIVELNKKYDL